MRDMHERKVPLGDEAGATAVEYGLLIAFIAAVIIATVIVFGGKVLSLYNDLCSPGSPFC
jgi:pilus assembly protein Flp/PilA